MLRYHKKIYFPTEDNQKLHEFNDVMNRKSFKFTAHCLDNLKFRTINLEDVLQFVKNNVIFRVQNIFEYYKINDIEKACYRIVYNNRSDIILVMDKYKTIITIYFNEKNDIHISLDKNLYQSV